MSSETVTIRFEGKSLTCRADATVAVALWENGITHLSHSPKYGHPRGVTCARGQCTACLMRIDGVPNVRACETPVREGLDVRRQDAGAFYAAPLQKSLSIGSAFFPVGFYYKWFTRPASLSRLFLKGIRPLSGVGRLPEQPVGTTPSGDPADAANEAAASEDLGRYATVVVGGGPSGLTAARRSPGPVLLIDDHTRPGGQRRRALQALAEAQANLLERFPLLQSAHQRLQTAVAEIEADSAQVEFRGDVRAVAGYPPDGLLLRQDDKLMTVACDRLVWAAGALDRLGLFPGNDTPGVVGPRALYRLALRDGLDLTDRRVLVIGGGLDLWLSACLLSTLGARVNLVVSESGWQSEVSAAVDFGWQLTTGLHLAGIKAQGRRLLATLTPECDAPGPLDTHLNLRADLAVICGRPKPAYDIPQQLGCDLSLQPDAGGFLPRGTADGAFSGPLPGGPTLDMLGEAAGALPRDQVRTRHREVTP